MTYVNGGSVPSSLATLVKALPLILPIGSVAIHLDSTHGALESWVRRDRIAPPMLFGSRRAWLDSELAFMPKRDEARASDGAGRHVLDRRIETLSTWLEIVALCGDRFDFEAVPAGHDQRRPREEDIKGRGGFEAVCRRLNSALVWHRLPYTYGSLRHDADHYRHLISGRLGNIRLVRTVDVIAWNLAEQLAQATHARALRAA